jgi:hypothetical protein
MLAVAPAFFPVAMNVAVSVWPAAVGAYSTVTAHDFFGPRLVPVQASDVIENASEPESATFSAPDAEPPEFLSVKAFEAVCPGVTAP